MVREKKQNMSRPESEFVRRVRLKIIETRKSLGVTQVELARRLDCTQTQISSLEVGRLNLTLEWVVWIAKALDVDLRKIMNLNQKKGQGGKGKRQRRPT